MNVRTRECACARAHSAIPKTREIFGYTKSCYQSKSPHARAHERCEGVHCLNYFAILYSALHLFFHHPAPLSLSLTHTRTHARTHAPPPPTHTRTRSQKKTSHYSALNAVRKRQQVPGWQKIHQQNSLDSVHRAEYLSVNFVWRVGSFVLFSIFNVRIRRKMGYRLSRMSFTARFEHWGSGSRVVGRERGGGGGWG